MNLRCNRTLIPTIMILALVVATLVTSTWAVQQNDTSRLYQSPMGSAQGVTGTGISGPAVPPNLCYSTCTADKSRIMRSVCWLGCGYFTD